MTFPNLIGCGAGKSGTTSLYYYLSQHPQIYMAAVKEVHFFSRHFHEGTSWYESNFSAGRDKQIIGEFSTSYMTDTAVPERIASLIPDAKLLFLLRSPIERAYSNYWFSVSIGSQAREQSFSDAIRSQAGQKKYLETGCYHQYIDRFLHYFPSNQIHIMITEEFRKAPIEQMAICYKFLGVDATFQPDVNKQYNVTLVTKSGPLGTAYAFWMMTKKRVKPMFKRFPVSLRSGLAQIEKLTFRQVMSEERPPISQKDRIYLSKFFDEQNEKLKNLIGRDIPDWQ